MEQKRGIRANWFWGLLGLLGILGYLLNQPLYYIFFVFFLFFLEPVINREMWIGIAVQAVVGTAAVLGAFVYGLSHFAGLPGEETLTGAQTMAFIVLNCAELIVVYAFRSERFSLFSIGLFSNRAMLGATALSFFLLLAVVYVPALDPVFYTTNLPLGEWLVMIPLMLLPFVAAEATKLYWRRREA